MVLRAGTGQRTKKRLSNPTHLSEECSMSDERDDGVAETALSRVAASADLLVEIFLYFPIDPGDGWSRGVIVDARCD